MTIDDDGNDGHEEEGEEGVDGEEGERGERGEEIIISHLKKQSSWEIMNPHNDNKKRGIA